MLAINQTGDNSRPESVQQQVGEPDGVGPYLRSAEQQVLSEPVPDHTVVLSCVATLLDGSTLDHALDGFANFLHKQFEATRVVVAVCDSKGELALRVISQQAVVNPAMSESQLLNEAMREACDLERPVYSTDSDDALGILSAHRVLSSRKPELELASIPLFDNEQLQGALLIERSGGVAFRSTERDQLQMIALTISPLFALRRQAARGLFTHFFNCCRDALTQLFGHQYPGRRAALVCLTALSILAVLVPINHSVVANAELVPLERRLVTSPVAGFIEKVSVVPGQRVSKNQVLARLDRRDLDLELATRVSELASAKAVFRAAMASHDRQETAIARARLDRERALIELIQQRIHRSELRAPIDGLVISGDLSDVIGMPVGLGDTLFEIAPAEGYEVHLLVNEKDIADIYTGQPGAIKVGSDPNASIKVTVTAIHPVAESSEGGSQFRVRGSLESSAVELLRPGQRGLARLQAGKTTLASKMFNPLFRQVAHWRWRFFG